MAKERTPIQQAIDLIAIRQQVPDLSVTIKVANDITKQQLITLRDTTERDQIIQLKIESYPWRKNNMKLAEEAAIAWYDEKYEKNDYL